MNIVTERSGDPICIMITAVDVTEKRRMEEALRESEERYRTLAESAPDIIFLIDVEGNILYMNSAGGRLLGVEPGTLQGRNIREVFPPGLQRGGLRYSRKRLSRPRDSSPRRPCYPGTTVVSGLRRASSRRQGATAPSRICSGSAGTSPDRSGMRSSSGSRPWCSGRWMTP